MVAWTWRDRPADQTTANDVEEGVDDDDYDDVDDREADFAIAAELEK